MADKAMVDSNKPFYRWFTCGELNTCHSCVDRHIDEGRGDQLALIYDSPLAGVVRKITYRELRDEVAQCAGALRGLGVDKGDTVIIYMPMVAEAAIAMLDGELIGAIHSVVFGGFAAPDLAQRVGDAKPKAMVSASCGLWPGTVGG